jgi:hypothetical protein
MLLGDLNSLSFLTLGNFQTELYVLLILLKYQRYFNYKCTVTNNRQLGKGGQVVNHPMQHCPKGVKMNILNEKVFFFCAKKMLNYCDKIKKNSINIF